MKNLFQSGQKTLYRAEYEHDACGVGVVANIKGIASHQIVKNGIEVLVNLAHRGAAGSAELLHQLKNTRPASNADAVRLLELRVLTELAASH